MIEQRQGWVLDLSGEAINLDHVRRVRIGSRFQDSRGQEDRPDGVTVFHVEAEMVGAQCGEARPVLVQNLADRVSAEHWVACRFWQPEVRHDSVRETPLAKSVREVMTDRTLPLAQKLSMVQGLGAQVNEDTNGWQIIDPTSATRADLVWEIQARPS